jgi:hypothetical protein
VGCGHSIVGIADSNPVGDTDVSLVSVVYCQVEVPGMGRSPFRGVQPKVYESVSEIGVTKILYTYIE